MDNFPNHHHSIAIATVKYGRFRQLFVIIIVLNREYHQNGAILDFPVDDEHNSPNVLNVLKINMFCARFHIYNL